MSAHRGRVHRLSIPTWAAWGSGTSPRDAAWGFWLLLLPWCSGLEYKELEVQARPDGMWPWVKSPAKQASEDTDLKGAGRETLLILTFHLT